MKKILILLFGLILIFSGCQQTQKSHRAVATHDQTEIDSTKLYVREDTTYACRVLHVVTPPGYANFWLCILKIDSCEYFSYDYKYWVHKADCSNPAHKQKPSTYPWSTNSSSSPPSY